MREILFRAKRIDNGEWVEGIYMPRPNSPGKSKYYIVLISDAKWYEVDPKTVCQYTGLTGKNGRKIFEGDIILHEVAGKIKVQFEKSEFMVIGIDRTMFRAWLSSIHGNFKIIGNIFDNPELIGE